MGLKIAAHGSLQPRRNVCVPLRDNARLRDAWCARASSQHGGAAPRQRASRFHAPPPATHHFRGGVLADQDVKGKARSCCGRSDAPRRRLRLCSGEVRGRARARGACTSWRCDRRAASARRQGRKRRGTQARVSGGKVDQPAAQ
eukprot:364443-Chlamydomonas_euryale.AAC.5